jgi:23S rRNA pseudouridine1911/1915/1917 synthase
VPEPTNRGFEYRERIPEDAEGEGVLDHVARRWPHSSRAEWAERIERGLVRLDALPVAATSVVRRGQSLTWTRPPWPEPEAPAEFEVLHEDAEVLAVAKPAGLPTLPGAGFYERTLLQLVRARVPEAAPLHRLGRFTSGVVLFGKTSAARAALARQWADRKVEKRYRALARGTPAHDRFVVTAPIGPVAHATLGSVHASCANGKPAESRVTVVERRATSFLCDVAIATGRPHQIRIHLACAGHPLSGDPLYAAGGLPHPGSRALPGDPGYLLHAAAIGFAHPRTGTPTRIECPIPPGPLTAL